MAFGMSRVALGGRRRLVASSAAAPTAPILSNKTSGWTAGDNPPGWRSEYPDGVVYDTGTNTGDKIRARWRTNGGSWTTEADQQLTSDIIIAGGWAWPILQSTVLAGSSFFEVQEQTGRFTSGSETGTSAWSNVWSDTMNAPSSVAVLSTAAGVNRNSHVTISGSPALTYTGATAWGAFQADRASIQATNDNTQFEVTITALPASSQVVIGWCNTTDDMNNGSNQAPGRNTSNGIGVEMSANSIIVYWNSAGNSVTLSSTVGVFAVGDVFTFKAIKSTHTIEVWRTRSGTTVQIGSTVSTVPSLSSWYAFVAPKNADAGTVNFGGSAFSKALSGGTVMYG